MKIQENDLYKHIGDVIKVYYPEDQEKPEYIEIPNGVYVITEVEPDFLTLYDIKNEINVQGNIIDSEITKIYTPIKERLELLYESNVKLAMQLSNEGWVPDGAMDINPLLEKIKILQVLMKEENEES